MEVVVADPPRADGRVHYFALTEEEQDALHEWLYLHDIDPATVPIHGLLELDEATGEWRIERYVLRDDGRVRLAIRDGGLPAPVTVAVRRRSRADLPWRMA